MKEGNFMKKVTYILLVTSLMLFLAGCKKEQETDIKEQVDNIDASEEEVEKIEVPEHVKYEVTGNETSNHLTVDADIILPEINNLPVYSMEALELSDEFIKGYADKLYDNGEYRIIKPYEICTLEELEKEIQYCDDKIAEYGIDWENVYEYSTGHMNSCGIGTTSILFEQSEMTECIDIAKNNELYIYEDGQVIYWNEANGGGKFGQGKLIGAVDGEDWHMGYYYRDATSDNPFSSFLVSMTPVVKKEGYIMDYVGMDPTNDSINGGANILDVDKAETDAREFLSRIGFDDMEVIGTLQVVKSLNPTDVYSYEPKMDGYCFIMTPSYKDASPLYWVNRTAQSNMVTVAGEEKGYEQFYVYITVTSEGVHQVAFNQPYNIKEELSSDTTLLDFDTIDAIAQEYMIGVLDSDNYIGDVKRIELSYATVGYDDGSIAMVPVWFYYASYQDINGEAVPYFGINAIDGSLIFCLNVFKSGPTWIY